MGIEPVPCGTELGASGGNWRHVMGAGRRIPVSGIQTGAREDSDAMDAMHVHADQRDAVAA